MSKWYDDDGEPKTPPKLCIEDRGKSVEFGVPQIRSRTFIFGFISGFIVSILMQMLLI
ncbi:MAG TPA: DNA cytosine methyltransferase [bacterium]|nr:DNA cytosine methyltransferase [bacterium]